MSSTNSEATTMPRVSGLFGSCKVVPVISVENADDAEPILHALEQAGMTMIEVTLRTTSGLKVIETMSKLASRAVIGAGTLMRPEHFTQVRDAGARFAVSPALTEELVDAAIQTKLPYLPGVATPSEVQMAYQFGFLELKFFPAGLMGGPAWLSHLKPIYSDLSFCVTGGVLDSNIRSYLEVGNVFAAGGAYTAPRQLIATRQWKALEEAAMRSIAAGIPRSPATGR